MESNSIHSEQEVKEKKLSKFSTIVNGDSIIYMLIFYLVTLLVIGSMIFQFISLRNIWVSDKLDSVTMELIDTINTAIPYDNLILALIIYCLSMFGLEGTRAVIKSFNVVDISKKAKNMPAYKRNRLIQILITFALLTIGAMILQMICINHGIAKADFQLSLLTSGIGVFMSLLAYSDIGPKVSKQIGNLVSNSKEKSETEPDSEEESFTTEQTEK